jgi:hypothetical protein
MKEVGVKVVHVHEPHDAQYEYHYLPHVKGAKQEEEEQRKPRESVEQGP